jgi:hypothetical protein
VPERTFQRLFTLQEANALLPRLRPLAERLMEVRRRTRDELSLLQAETGLAPDDPELAREIALRPDLASLVVEEQTLVEEIEREGAVVNGPDEGLVDFPALLDGEIVFLCWRSSERRVAHWHRIPDGFAGRRPLLDHDEAEGPLEATVVH